MSESQTEEEINKTTTPSNVHPSFNDADTDITLTSLEGTIFHVQSSTLSLASGWFRTLFALPQNPSQHPPAGTAETISVTESTSVLAALLSIITWQPVPTLDKIDFIENLLVAGEKYEMPTVVSIMRLAVMTSQLLDVHPIRIYGIAASRGWIAEAKLASTKTIGLDLLSSECIQDLRTVDSLHMTNLMLLHRRRRDMFCAALASNSNVFVINPVFMKAKDCSLPHSVAHCVRQSQMHKSMWWGNVERLPTALSKPIVHGAEMGEILEMTCQGCHQKMYNKEATLKKLSEVVDSLPTAVEVCHAYYSILTLFVRTSAFFPISFEITAARRE
ncbi:hypothetical protein BC835DRAFT_705455 [Cytidiella melzeri]|nr:hypothetical protein BC835DRAFT_705455 [Cytidiella melzeri]